MDVSLVSPQRHQNHIHAAARRVRGAWAAGGARRSAKGPAREQGYGARAADGDGREGGREGAAWARAADTARTRHNGARGTGSGWERAAPGGTGSGRGAGSTGSGRDAGGRWGMCKGAGSGWERAAGGGGGEMSGMSASWWRDAKRGLTIFCDDKLERGG